MKAYLLEYMKRYTSKQWLATLWTVAHIDYSLNKLVMCFTKIARVCINTMVVTRSFLKVMVISNLILLSSLVSSRRLDAMFFGSFTYDRKYDILLKATSVEWLLCHISNSIVWPVLSKVVASTMNLPVKKWPWLAWLHLLHGTVTAS